MKKLIFIVLLFTTISTIRTYANNLEQTHKQTKTTKNRSVKSQTKPIFEDVNVEVFAQLIAKKKGQILDVRTPDEWKEGTIKNAIKMNYYDENFVEQLKKLNKNEPVYVYCRSGNRSGKAAKQMKEMGFTKIFNLIGGYNAWSGAGKEVAK